MDDRERFFNRFDAEERRAARQAARRQAEQDEWYERVKAARAKHRAEVDEMAREAPTPWWLA